MVVTFLPIFRSCAHVLTAEEAVPLKIIFLNRQFFIFLLFVLVPVFCEKNTTPTLLSAPFKTSENEPTTMPSSFTTSEAPTSLGKVDKSHLLMSITPNTASGAQTILNFSETSKFPGTIRKQTATKTKLTAALEHATTSTKPKVTESAEAMNTEKEASTSSTRSTSRSLIDIIPTEFIGDNNTSSSALPKMEPTPKRSKFLSDIQTFIKQLMSTVGSELTRKLLKADLSTDCTVGLLHFTRAIQDLEPWALRLIDATAKYPTGLLQGTVSDLGAYDECIETVVQDEYGATSVRGQYCDVHLSILDQEAFDQVTLQAIINLNKRMARFKSYFTDKNLPGIRLGVCVIDTCREQDLVNIGSVLAGSFMKVAVKDCVTIVHEGMSFVQACIIAFLVVLAAVIAGGTMFELFAKNWDCERNKAIFYKCISAFSLVSNSKRILQVRQEDNPETRRYRFAYGLRFLSMLWICLGHSYGMINENIARIFNAVYIFETWGSPIISAAFMAVDTFFFMSGYLLYLTLSKQKRNRATIAVVAIIRRFIRITIPTFFMIMCIYLLPLMASGPNSKEFYDRFYAEVRNHWWHLVALIYNWRGEDYEVVKIIKYFMSTLTHLWYLSVDFQLFVVAVAVIQTFRTNKWLTASIFAVLSLLCCGIAAWQIYGTYMLPFMVTLHTTYRELIDTTTQYYQLPFYHAVCFFSGCMTFTVVEQYGKVKISKVVQALFWFVALSCGLCCMYMKLDWNLNGEQASETKRMVAAFIDRILWSVCVAWFWFSCSTGRGGFVNRFLSWNGFVPLGRLCFGVYLIHLPFYKLFHRISRERRFYSHFTLVSNSFLVLVWSCILSYILCVACELPTANLEKMLFLRDTKSVGNTEDSRKQHRIVEEDVGNISVITLNHCT